MAGWETLRRQITISGRVTAAADGRAVVGAQVQITAAPDAFMSKVRLAAKQHGAAWGRMAERVDRTMTAVDGAYFFLDLPAGDYTMTAYLPQRLPAYDYAESAAQVSRDAQGTIQQTRADVALTAFSGKTFPPVFVPTDIAGCQLWLQAEALLLQDGEAVTSWPDSSGQANDAAQSATTNAPIFNSNSFHGHPALAFDGSASYLNLNLAETATEHTFFAVYDQTPTEGSSNYIFEAQTGRLTLDCAQSSAPHNMRWNDGSWRTVVPALAGKQIVTWLFKGTTGELFRNGVSLGSATYTPRPLGGMVALGTNYQGRSSFFKGCVAEFLYYNRALSLDERRAAEAYLNNRYAIFS